MPPGGGSAAGSRRRAQISVNLCTAIDAADAALLPAVFRALEVAFALSPSSLATLVLAQSVTGAVFAPLWGWLADGDLVPRRTLLLIGCGWWALLTACTAAATGFWSLLLARTVLGAALPLISPVAQARALIDPHPRVHTITTCSPLLHI